jgi:hypothetical protein
VAGDFCFQRTVLSYTMSGEVEHHFDFKPLGIEDNQPAPLTSSTPVLQLQPLLQVV